MCFYISWFIWNLNRCCLVHLGFLIKVVCWLYILLPYCIARRRSAPLHYWRSRTTTLLSHACNSYILVRLLYLKVLSSASHQIWKFYLPALTALNALSFCLPCGGVETSAVENIFGSSQGTTTPSYFLRDIQAASPLDVAMAARRLSYFARPGHGEVGGERLRCAEHTLGWFECCWLVPLCASLSRLSWGGEDRGRETGIVVDGGFVKDLLRLFLVSCPVTLPSWLLSPSHYMNHYTIFFSFFFFKYF